MSSKIRSGRTSSFKKDYARLPVEIQQKADETFKKWRENPAAVNWRRLHGMKEGASIWTVELGLRWRALAAVNEPEAGVKEVRWFWVGAHEDYNVYVDQIRSNSKKLTERLASAPELPKPGSLNLAKGRGAQPAAHAPAEARVEAGRPKAKARR